MSTRPIGMAIPLLCMVSACDSGSFATHSSDQIPAKLAFLGEPPATVEGGAVGRVVVTVEDASGNTVSNARTNITVAIGTNPAGATLSGTTTVGAVNGVAVFSDLNFDKSGKGYTLVAAATGLTKVTSRPFDVDPIPTKLAFVVEPTALASGAIEPAVRVSVQDENGNSISVSTTNVTIAIGSNPAGGTLSGTTTVPTANGVAIFSNLTIDRVGTYTLTASASGLMSATSSPFDVGDTIGSLLPPCAPVGGGAFSLAVSGSNFVNGSVVRWNGSDRPTIFLNENEILAQISASDVAAAATAYVTVFNPAPRGSSSNALPFAVPGPGIAPASIAVDLTGKFAYVANGGCPDTFPGNVSMFRIDGTTGALTSIGPPVAADFGPHSVIADPSGKFVYVANDGAFEVNAGSVSMYAIDATTGALTSKGALLADPFRVGGNPYSVAVHPGGKFVYAALESGLAPTGVAALAIDPNSGTLTLTGQTSSAGRAIAVAVHPSGKFGYVINMSGFVSGDTVSMCTIDTSGTFTCAGTIATGPGPRSIAIDPSGRFAYVANSGAQLYPSSESSSVISMYAIDATTGILTSIGSMLGPVGGVYSIAVHPSGKFVYTADASNTVSVYGIDATTGGLTNAFGGAATGTLPSSIAIDPSGRFAYVTNSGSNDVSMYTIDASTGAVTLIGKISI